MSPVPLVMKFAGGIVKHLGMQMYAGPVPAIAELIANAWDANATKVEIRIPLDTPIGDGATIEVADDGEGMSYEDCNDKYLIVGRDRRSDEGDFSSNHVRRIMAHKGIGKLSGFGIATIVEIETVRNGRLTQFSMDYSAIERLTRGDSYYPTLLKGNEPTRRPNGTLVRLRKLNLSRAINGGQFLRSMARRFSILSSGFQVMINQEILTKQMGAYEFNFPIQNELEEGERIEDGWGVTQLEGAGEIRWWVGFTKDTIKDEEARGISVITRGKLAQAPWFFGLSGGTWGQHGIQYMTGEVMADFLDEREDLIATDRATVLWYHPTAVILQEWARRKIGKLLSRWADLRAEKRIEELTAPQPGREDASVSVTARIEKFPEPEKKELKKAVRALAQIPTMEPEKFQENVNFLLQAYENRAFTDMVRQITEAAPEAQAKIIEILREFNVLEAVRVAQLVWGHIEVIRKFRQLIDLKVPEKPDMQEHLKNYPWLIDYVWGLSAKHEKRLQTLLEKEFGVQTDKTGGTRRVDYFCLGDLGRAFVVEVKRPGDTVGRAELEQIERYVHFLRDELDKVTDPARKRLVFGFLVASNIKGERSKLASLEKDGIYVRTFENLLWTAEQGHAEYLEVAKSKAPPEDPRIMELSKQDEEAARS